MVQNIDRRKFIQVGATGFAATIAGCSGVSTTSSDANTSTTDGTKPPEDDISIEHDHQSDTSDFSQETLAKAKELGRTVQQSVVKLTDGAKGGTGWIVDDGQIVTNSHVVLQSETMTLETFDGATGSVTRVGYHENMIPDIALMETEMQTPNALSLNTNPSLSNGDPILVVGHPGKVGDWVISLGRYETYRESFDWILADVPTNQGNSGSPLVTLDGDVIGCVSGVTSGGSQSKLNRSEEVYTEFPEPAELATATSAQTIERWVTEWK